MHGSVFFVTLLSFWSLFSSEPTMSTVRTGDPDDRSRHLVVCGTSARCVARDDARSLGRYASASRDVFRFGGCLSRSVVSHFVKVRRVGLLS